MNISALDSRGPGWREWIFTNFSAGCDPIDMHRQMLADGWADGLAEQALIAAAAELFPDRVVFYEAVPLPVVPAVGTIVCNGHPIAVTLSLADPGVALCENVLSSEECAELGAFARQRGLAPSTVIDETSGDAIAHPERTSAGLMLRRGETALIAQIEARLAALTDWPIANGEGLQVLRYAAGQEYRAHFDSFPGGAGGAEHTRHGGQRVNTLVVYLQAAEQGGGTFFPALGMTLWPRAGSAIVFRNVDHAGRRAPASLHAGVPVERGEKIVITYWQREQPIE
ncbi:2OG-Fe(II) oxygenase [Novosphingobium sp.]|uniref:2OG-Fe(II) oxygenase n=1 Tax=Novosphingobium sp. TaxID=1874826 RepID=UPI003D1443A0